MNRTQRQDPHQGHDMSETKTIRNRKPLCASLGWGMAGLGLWAGLTAAGPGAAQAAPGKHRGGGGAAAPMVQAASAAHMPSPTKPDEDEIVEEIPTAASVQAAQGGRPLDLGLAGRLESLEQANQDLKNRLRDLEKRITMVTNPETALRIQGYIDFGFFGFFRGNGSGITTYSPPDSPFTKYAGISNPEQRNAAYRSDERVQRFPEFFSPCGFAADGSVARCEKAPASGISQNRWHFLGDPLATTINTPGHPADIRAQNNPSQSSLAVPYDYIQSGGRPTFIINELNLMPIAKLGAGLKAQASVNFYPRSASISVGDKQDGGGVLPAGPTSVGDYLWVDFAFLEYATAFQNGRHQLSIFAGRFDPNIGIEYRVRKSPDRFGVTPSLLCRYSCGTPLGLKARGQFFDELITFALAIHNGPSYMETFRFAENTDKKFMKTISGRASIHCSEKNHCQKVNVELGVSGEFGGQVDGFYDVGQGEFDPFVKQWTVDVDLHVEFRGLELRAEFLKTVADGFQGSATKPALPRLEAIGFYAETSYRFLNWLGGMVRFDLRDASHIDYSIPFAYVASLWRVTAGARFDINDNVAVKAEFVHVQPFGRMADGLNDMRVATGSTTAGDFAADYVTSSVVLRY